MISEQDLWARHEIERLFGLLDEELRAKKAAAFFFFTGRDGSRRILLRAQKTISSTSAKDS
jgi:hypothetical protein